MKQILRIFSLTILPTIFFAAIGLVVWQWNVKKLHTEEQKELTELINTTIEREAKKGLLLPKIIFLKSDTLQKEQFSDSLISQLSSILTEKYLNNESISFDKLDIKPFYILPEKPNKQGQYILTETQLKELNAHLDFLTKQVSIEVDRTKEEVGRDIDRLNTWVSIWIGVIGFLGIFIPIVVNIDSSKRASEAKEESKKAKIEAGIAKEDSKNAKEEANKALTKINNAQGQIDKINGIETKIGEAEEKIVTIETLSSSAYDKSEEAIKESNQLKGNVAIIIAINGLNQFTPQTIIHFSKENILPQYRRVLTGILNELRTNSNFFNSDLMRNWLGQVAINIQTISFYKFINPEHTQLLNEFAQLITNSLDNYSQEQFDIVVNGLENLIKNLNIEN